MVWKHEASWWNIGILLTTKHNSQAKKTNKHRPDGRRSIRLPGYDYSQEGAYVITIVVKDRACRFGNIVGNAVELNTVGMIVQEEWEKTKIIRPNVDLDTFVVMPIHVHGIIILNESGRGTSRRAPTVERFGKPTSNSIPTIVRLFKSVSTKRINEICNTPGVPVWQRNYYEHIIRDDDALNNVREYILNNPTQWALDKENPF